MSRILAFVKRDLLVWARTSAGYSIDDAAKKLSTKPERLKRWESGDERPTLGTVRRMAQVYKRQLSDFFLPKRPKEEPMPHDFRRLPGEVALTYSPALRLQVRLAQQRRAIVRDLLDELDSVPSKFTLRTKLGENPEDVGWKLRALLKVEFDQQSKWRNPRAAYNAWRARIEAAGVLVFQAVGVGADEILGFSLAYDFLPVVAVNRKSKPRSRTFTLLHELAHLALRESGLCDIDEEQFRQEDEQNAEVFCNQVAASALVPKKYLLADPIVAERGLGAHIWSDEALKALANVFCVSEEVILRRLLTFGRTTAEFYRVKRKMYLARYEEIEEQERAKLAESEIRRNLPQEAISNFGRSYTRVVLESLNQDNITLMDASRFLSIRPRQLRKIEQLMMAE